MDNAIKTIKQFNESYKYNNAYNIAKKNRPILKLKSENGEKVLTIIEDRSTLPFYERLFAYLGLGDASLKNIYNYIHEKLKDAHHISEADREDLAQIDKKIIKLNKNSFINQKIYRLSELIENASLPRKIYGDIVDRKNIHEILKKFKDDEFTTNSINYGGNLFIYLHFFNYLIKIYDNDKEIITAEIKKLIIKYSNHREFINELNSIIETFPELKTLIDSDIANKCAEKFPKETLNSFNNFSIEDENERFLFAQKHLTIDSIQYLRNLNLNEKHKRILIKDITGIPENLKKEISEKYETYGLNDQEYEKIEKFCIENWNKYSEVTRIKKDEINQLPRTLQYVPNEGWFINLGAKGSLESLGEGSRNRATKLLRLPDGKLFVKRSGEHLITKSLEIDIHKQLKGKSENIAVGIPITYEGTIGNRKAISTIKFIIPNGELRRKAFEIIKGKEKMSEALKTEITKLEFGAFALDYIKFNGRNKFEKLEFIMDNISGGDLDNLLKDKKSELTAIEKITISIGIANGLAVLHEMGFVHCDLKPENILMDDRNPKICDFDLSVKKDVGIKTRGTIGFIAPELCRATEIPIMANEKFDIWSLGCVMVEIVKSRKQPQNESCYQEYEIKKLFPNYQNEEYIDHVIYKCLIHDPNKRPTAAEVVKMLEKVKTG